MPKKGNKKYIGSVDSYCLTLSDLGAETTPRPQQQRPGEYPPVWPSFLQLLSDSMSLFWYLSSFHFIIFNKPLTVRGTKVNTVEVIIVFSSIHEINIWYASHKYTLRIKGKLPLKVAGETRPHEVSTVSGFLLCQHLATWIWMPRALSLMNGNST